MKKYISLLLGSQIRIINSVRPELQWQECQLHDSMYISIQMHSEPLVHLCFSYLGVHNCHVIINYERARTTHRRIKTRLIVNQWVFPFQYGWHLIERFLSCCRYQIRVCAPGGTGRTFVMSQTYPVIAIGYNLQEN